MNSTPKPPSTFYRGERVYDKQCYAGVRVTVNGKPLDPRASWKLRNHSPTGYEWGYGGAGPAQLALALVYDATGNAALAQQAYQWFKWAVVSQWLGDEWEITAAEIQTWLEQWREERDAVTHFAERLEEMGCGEVLRCRVCGCTDYDCRQCVAVTGRPCSWVEGEEPLICTRCADEEDAALQAEMEGGGI